MAASFKISTRTLHRLLWLLSQQVTRSLQLRTAGRCPRKSYAVPRVTSVARPTAWAHQALEGVDAATESRDAAPAHLVQRPTLRSNFAILASRFVQGHARTNHVKGRLVTRLTIRNSADFDHAIRVLRGPLAKTIKDVRCEGWPRLVLASDGRLGVRCSQRITEMQESVARVVCAIKYGTDDLRYLKTADKQAIELGIAYAPDQRGIAIDFSGATNVALQSAKSSGQRQSKWRMAGLFDWLRATNDDKKETWAGAAAKVGLAIVDKCPPWQITATLMVTALIGMNNIADIHKQKNTLEHAFKMHAEDNQQQLRLAELGKSIIIDKAGHAAKLDAKAQRALDKEEQAKAERVRILASMELEHPLVRFVSTEADNIYAAALDMAPEQGIITVNGMELPAKTARGGAAAIRQANKKKRLDNDGWTAIVRRAEA
jgi:hypothetical protein